MLVGLPAALEVPRTTDRVSCRPFFDLFGHLLGDAAEAGLTVALLARSHEIHRPQGAPFRRNDDREGSTGVFSLLDSGTDTFVVERDFGIRITSAPRQSGVNGDPTA